MSEPIRVVKGDDLAPADPTPGMQRSLAFQAPGLWAGQVETQPGSTSGWHHHDVNESSLYVVSGVLRLEALGASRVQLLVADGFNESCQVMQDVEGNEFCLD